MKNNRTIYYRLGILILNSECLNMRFFCLPDAHSNLATYLLLKLAAVTLDSAQIDLKLFTLILAKIGYNLNPNEEPIPLTLLL